MAENQSDGAHAEGLGAAGMGDNDVETDIQVQDSSNQGVGIETVTTVLDTLRNRGQDLQISDVSSANDPAADVVVHHAPEAGSSASTDTRFALNVAGTPTSHPSHPSSATPKSLPKKHWTAAEDAELISLVKVHGARSWAKIADKMGAGRSGASCCARWCRLSGEKVDRKKDANSIDGDADTGDDDTADPLLSLTDVNVDSSLVNLSPKQASKREKWSRWTPAEDAHLVQLVKKHGASNWPVIAAELRNEHGLPAERSADSCCGRWTHYMKPKHGPLLDENGVAIPPSSRSNNNAANPRWTPREDAQLRLLRLQHPNASWASIGQQLVPARSGGSCRARFAQSPLVEGAFAVDVEGLGLDADGARTGEKRKRGRPKKSLNDDGLEQSIVVDDPPVASTSGHSSSSPFDLPVSASGDLVVEQPPVSVLPISTATTVEQATPNDDNPLAGLLDPSLMDVDVGAEKGKDAEGTRQRSPSLNGSDKDVEEQLVAGKSKSTKSKGKERENVDSVTWTDEQLVSAAQAALPPAPIDINMPSTRSTKRRKVGPEDLEALKRSLGEKVFDEITLTTGVLKPAIANPWTKEEEDKLMELANGTGKRSWAKIANELGTGRTAASVSGRFQKLNNLQELSSTRVGTSTSSDPKPNFTGKPWTAQDDEELRAGVNRHGKNKWELVGAEMSRPRSGQALVSRWYDHLADKSERGKKSTDIPLDENGEASDVIQESKPFQAKKRWSKAEDMQLRQMHDLYQPLYNAEKELWKHVGEAMDGRSGASCRLRWLNYVEKNTSPSDLPSNLDPELLKGGVDAVLSRDHASLLALLGPEGSGSAENGDIAVTHESPNQIAETAQEFAETRTQEAEIEA